MVRNKQNLVFFTTLEKEMGQRRSDSFTAVSVGPPNELSIKNHHSTTIGHCSTYLVVTVVPMHTAHNDHPGGNPAFTVFLSPAEKLMCNQQNVMQECVWICSVVSCRFWLLAELISTQLMLFKVRAKSPHCLATTFMKCSCWIVLFSQSGFIKAEFCCSYNVSVKGCLIWNRTNVQTDN